MSTETAEGLSEYHRSLAVTATVTLGGVLAGVASSMVATGAKDRLGLYVLAAAIVVEFGVMYLSGVDVTDFSTKDQLYVIFMTFALWFVSWTILLTTTA
ncbi:MAG: hypothetical protein ABEJ85_01825 [Haloarculaceae archaeon]